MTIAGFVAMSGVSVHYLSYGRLPRPLPCLRKDPTGRGLMRGLLSRIHSHWSDGCCDVAASGSLVGSTLLRRDRLVLGDHAPSHDVAPASAWVGAGGPLLM